MNGRQSLRPRVLPAGALADDLAQALTDRITFVAVTTARAAVDEMLPTIRTSLSSPEFATNMGKGVVEELRKPESAPIIEGIGSAAGAKIANIPWIGVGAFVFGGIVGGSIVYAALK